MGTKPLEMAMNLTPDIIILDLMLPGIDDWKCVPQSEKESADCRPSHYNADG
jgi:DNA-binding response OmpR family regulator